MFTFLIFHIYFYKKYTKLQITSKYWNDTENKNFD